MVDIFLCFVIEGVAKLVPEGSECPFERIGDCFLSRFFVGGGVIPAYARTETDIFSGNGCFVMQVIDSRLYNGFVAYGLF